MQKKCLGWDTQRNLTMLLDFYELTMSNGYLVNGMSDKIAIFDMFFRRIPEKAGFAIVAGLEQLISYLNNLSFTEQDIAFLRNKGIMDERFLDYLRHFTFQCDVWAIREGTPVFPNEPVVVVRGPIIQAQMIETMLLLSINHQSLIATKANRIVRAAQGRSVMEFGSRRAQSYDAAILGSRASYIGGCTSTANVLADREYGIPAVGTMAHSWIQVFDSEYEAFKSYAQLYPNHCTLLVDTYNVIRSGVPNAIRVFDEVIVPQGFRPKGIRIDSGDIAYLSKKSREMLDAAGYSDVAIVASNSLDEYIIRDLLIQDAKVDSFGVGEKLITSLSDPVFGGVYKLVAIEQNNTLIPKIKLSETVEKITTPYFKKLYRLFNKETGKAVADYVTCFDETIDPAKPLTLFDPNAIWKKNTVRNFEAKSLLEPIFVEGKCVYTSPPLDEIQRYCAGQIDLLWDEVRRFEYPHRYYVDFSQKLWDIKQSMLMKVNL